MKKESLSFCLLGAFLSTGAFADLSPEILCEQAQRIIIDDKNLNFKVNVKPEHFANINDFIDSKSSLDGLNVGVTSYTPDFSETALNYETLWCKMKKQTAIDKHFSYERESTPKNCADIQRQWAASILEAVPYLQPVADKISYGTTNHNTGLTWSISKVRMKPGSEGQSYLIEPQSLMTPDWIPVLGGMHYCKLLSPYGLIEFMDNIYSHEFDKVEYKLIQDESTQALAGPWVYGTDIKWTSLDSKDKAHGYSARVFARANKISDGYQGALILSPGGQLESANYRVLAKELALAGWVVFVVDYPYNLAVLDTANAAVDLAKNIGDVKITEQLPVALQNVLMSEQLKVVGLGHSLGGAVWGPLLNQETSPFDELLFYGVNGLIDFDSANVVANNVHFLFGVEDSVAFSDYTGENFLNFIAPLGVEKSAVEGLYSHSSKNVSVQILPEMNHFCIISDRSAGMLPVRFLDGPARVFKPCVEKLVTTINQTVLN